MNDDLVVSEKVTIPARELSWVATRASGPGGQNVNKVASKVELRFDFARSRRLDAVDKARLRGLAGARRLDAEGRVVMVSQKTRDQGRNLDDAREKLRLLIARALERPVRRVATKPSRGAERRRVEDKKQRGQTKLARRRVADE